MVRMFRRMGPRTNYLFSRIFGGLTPRGDTLVKREYTLEIRIALARGLGTSIPSLYATYEKDPGNAVIAALTCAHDARRRASALAQKSMPSKVPHWEAIIYDRLAGRFSIGRKYQVVWYAYTSHRGTRVHIYTSNDIHNYLDVLNKKPETSGWKHPELGSYHHQIRITDVTNKQFEIASAVMDLDSGNWWLYSPSSGERQGTVK